MWDLMVKSITTGLYNSQIVVAGIRGLAKAFMELLENMPDTPY